ncbi:MAG: CGNR zinc finger domain-containing protein [Rhizobiaceae bacterium]|nr:CGNR zinc finger domain-containing protein [Rhizobiaceae bacterium]
MAVEWSEHRFSGGVLALDVANTVVLRIDPARRFDRFDDPREIARFAEFASVFRARELHGARLVADLGANAKASILRLREATDALFRDAVEQGSLEGNRLSGLLSACAGAFAGAGRFSPEGAPQGSTVGLAAATARSALRLLEPERLGRLRICANCGWLFLDRSRNASRVWCDMAVCGNRRKAARHYGRRKEARSGNVETL